MMTLAQCLVILAISHLTHSYPYPFISERRYPRTSYQPTYSYIPVALPYALPQTYDDSQDDINALPYYYYPVSDSGTDQEEEYPPSYPYGLEPSTNFPYGQEQWYEGNYESEAVRAAANAEARAAFLRNLIITQMYQDAAASAAVSPGHYMYPSSYQQIPEEQYDDNSNFQYGIKTTGVEEKERAKEFLRDEDEDVKELESLRKAAASKEGKRRRKQKAKETREKKSGLSLVTSKPILSDRSSFSDRKNAIASGQKEVVLPLPTRPARQPLNELSQRLHTRSEKPSAYQTIKQLLAMEKTVKKTGDSNLRKRFISSEEQLTAQLNNLKKSTL